MKFYILANTHRKRKYNVAQIGLLSTKVLIFFGFKKLAAKVAISCLETLLELSIIALKDELTHIER